MSLLRDWVMFTVCTYSIQRNQNTNIKSQPDYIHKALPIVWLIAQSENTDALRVLFKFMKEGLPLLCSPNDDTADELDVKYHTGDNSAAIQAAVSDVFPHCTQGNCVVHAKMSLKKKSIIMGIDSNEGKVIDRYRMMAPESPSLLSFKSVSECVLVFLRNSTNLKGSSVAKGIYEYYVKGQKCNWFHVSSGMVSTNMNLFKMRYVVSNSSESHLFLSLYKSRVLRLTTTSARVIIEQLTELCREKVCL